MPELREVFELTTKQLEPDADAWREQEKRQRRANRNRKTGAFAVAAALGVVAVVAILRPNATTPPKEPGANQTDATADEEVAMGFVEAYGAFDADRAITFLSDVADIRALVGSVGSPNLEGSRQELRLLTSLFEAMRYEQMLSSCEGAGGSSFGTEVRCAFDFHLLGSDAFGHAPFDGSYFDVTVRGGEIVRASLHLEIERFSPEMWEPFARWVSATRPEDAAVMYGDETYSGARLTERSIRLWDQRVRGYVEQVGSIRVAPTGKLSRIVGGVPFSFEIPAAGWEQFGTISVNKSIVGPQGAEAIIFWTTFPGGDEAVPCRGLLRPTVGPTVAQVAAAVSTASGTELLAGPSEVNVGGHPAKHVMLAVREHAGCDPGYFYTWPGVQWGALWPETRVGDTIRVWIVDVDGTLLFIEAETNPQADSDLEREIEQIIGSIRFA